MKREIILLTITVLMLAICGCQIFPWYQRPCNRYFPDSIKEMCYNEMENAKNCIESKGEKIDKDSTIKVELVPGEKKIKGMWCFKDKEHYGDMWIGGLSYRQYIKVGCHPVTKEEVNPQVVKHEFGHFWLFKNNVMDHDGRFKECFINWNDVSAIKMQSIDDEIVSVDFVSE